VADFPNPLDESMNGLLGAWLLSGNHHSWIFVRKSFFSPNLTLWQQRSWTPFPHGSLPFGRRRLANELAFVPIGIMIRPLLKTEAKTADRAAVSETQRRGSVMKSNQHTPPAFGTAEHWMTFVIATLEARTYDKPIH
jgi:hypothetical protein